MAFIVSGETRPALGGQWYLIGAVLVLIIFYLIGAKADLFVDANQQANIYVGSEKLASGADTKLSFGPRLIKITVTQKGFLNQEKNFFFLPYLNTRSTFDQKPILVIKEPQIIEAKSVKGKIELLTKDYQLAVIDKPASLYQGTKETSGFYFRPKRENISDDLAFIAEETEFSPPTDFDWNDQAVAYVMTNLSTKKKDLFIYSRKEKNIVKIISDISSYGLLGQDIYYIGQDKTLSKVTITALNQTVKVGNFADGFSEVKTTNLGLYLIKKTAAESQVYFYEPGKSLRAVEQGELDAVSGQNDLLIYKKLTKAGWQNFVLERGKKRLAKDLSEVFAGQTGEISGYSFMNINANKDLPLETKIKVGRKTYLLGGTEKILNILATDEEIYIFGLKQIVVVPNV